MKSYIENLKLLNYKEWILLLFPFALLKPSFINIILVLSSFIFIFEIIKNKNFELVKLKWVYFYLLLHRTRFRFYRGQHHHRRYSLEQC